MGGGDLNLKKSWHPSTLKNIERVWKAEQVRDMEKTKIEQLQKELMEERSKQEMRQFAEDTGVVKKKQDRLDWMYQGVAGLMDRDQYLMGRKVDKNFEILKQEEEGIEPQDEDQQPGAIFAASSANAVVDLGNKIREDPLFEIKKQEMKTKKSLLSNPVKMKYLREMLEESLNIKKNKKKKHKKKKERGSSSDSEKEAKRTNEKHAQKRKHHGHEELDHSKQRRLHHKRHEDQHNKHSDGREHKSREDRHGERSRHHERDTRNFHRTGEKVTYDKRRDFETQRSSPSRGYHHTDCGDKRRHEPHNGRANASRTTKHVEHKATARHDTSSSDESTCNPPETASSVEGPVKCNDIAQRYRSMTDSTGVPKFGLIKRGSPPRRATQKLSPPKELPSRKEEKKTPVVHKRRALTEEEKEAARKQMLDNAQWREGQRKTIVDRYRRAEEHEEKMHKEGGRGSFIRPMLSKAAETGTVEARIKQKMHTVQRNRDAMDRNFARK